MYLIDSNIFLEVLLEQEKSNQVKKFIISASLNDLFISNFSLHSICIVLLKENQTAKLVLFLNEAIKGKIKVLSVETNLLDIVVNNANKFNLDFDDAYQYTAAKTYNLQLVSFDKDFDKTDIKRIEP